MRAAQALHAHGSTLCPPYPPRGPSPLAPSPLWSTATGTRRTPTHPPAPAAWAPGCWPEPGTGTDPAPPSRPSGTYKRNREIARGEADQRSSACNRRPPHHRQQGGGCGATPCSYLGAKHPCPECRTLCTADLAQTRSAPLHSQMPAGNVNVHIAPNLVGQVIKRRVPATAAGRDKGCQVDPAAHRFLARAASHHSSSRVLARPQRHGGAGSCMGTS